MQRPAVRVSFRWAPIALFAVSRLPLGVMVETQASWDKWRPVLNLSLFMLVVSRKTIVGIDLINVLNYTTSANKKRQVTIICICWMFMFVCFVFSVIKSSNSAIKGLRLATKTCVSMKVTVLCPLQTFKWYILIYPVDIASRKRV